MFDTDNKLTEQNYIWYDLGKPDKEGIFNQDFYNKKVLDIMDKKFIDNKITINRHGETYEENGEKILNDDGKREIEVLANKILDAIGNNKKINIHYSSKSKRINETLKILQEILLEKDIEVNPIDTNKLKSGNKKQNLSNQIFTKTGRVGKYILKTGKKSKGIPNFMLGHSTFIPGLDTLKSKSFKNIETKSDEVKHGEGMTFDFQKGKIVQDNKNIVELNLENYKDIISLLKNDTNFKNIVKKIEENKIDLVYLQNQINFIFSNKPELLKKYFILDVNYIKSIIEKLQEISEGIKFLSDNDDLNEKFEISTLKKILDRILDYPNIDEYIYGEIYEVIGFFKIMNDIFLYLLDKYSIDDEGKEYLDDKRVLYMEKYGLKYIYKKNISENELINEKIDLDIEYIFNPNNLTLDELTKKYEQLLQK